MDSVGTLGEMIDPVRMGKCTQCNVSGFDTLATQGTYPSQHFSSFFPSRHYTLKRRSEGRVGLDDEWFRLGEVLSKQNRPYHSLHDPGYQQCPAVPVLKFGLRYGCVVVYGRKLEKFNGFSRYLR